MCKRNQNHGEDFITSCLKYESFECCACCNESDTCEDSKLKKQEPYDSFADTIDEQVGIIKNREDKDTYTKDEVIKILEFYKRLHKITTNKINNQSNIDIV